MKNKPPLVPAALLLDADGDVVGDRFDHRWDRRH